MTAIHRASAAGLALGALVVATTPAFPAPPGLLTHEEALRAIQSHAEPEARRAAVQALAETGTSADQPLLVAALRDDDQVVRAMAESALWQVWSRSGDPEVDRLFVEGVAEMGSRMLRQAAQTFTRIIELKPEFAEGWNKRATVYYLAGESRKSIDDCAEVLKRNPRHFGALSGLGQIYFQLERYDEALVWFRKALEVNPNMAGVGFNIKRIETLMRERRGTQI